MTQKENQMPETDLLKPSDVARIFNQSLSWVSKHYRELGGIKIGGRVFFPPKEVMYERLFCGEKGLEVRLHVPRKEIYQNMVSHQEGGKKSRREAKAIIEETDSNRHGLFDSC